MDSQAIYALWVLTALQVAIRHTIVHQGHSILLKVSDMCRWEGLRDRKGEKGDRNGIKNKAAIALQCKLNGKLIAA